MKSSTKKLCKILLFVSAILCAALILLQLAPYWTYQDSESGTTKTISILGYLTLPNVHPDVTTLLNAGTSPAINSLAGTFCIVFLLGFVAVAFFFVKPNSRWISVWPLAVGLGGLIGYLTDPAWQLGSIYIVLIILCALLTITSSIVAVICLNSIKYWFMDPKDLPSAKE